MRDIIENGLNSIRLGLEDFEQAPRDAARLTSAVRNIYAGILILAKGKLYELSPPDSPGLLIRVLRPQLVNHTFELVPQERRTIGYDDVKSRFTHFRLTLDWKKIERIRAVRNDLEHFYHRGAESTVQEAVADAATVIRSLLDLLQLDPVGSLGQPSWEILLRNRELFEGELQTCRASFAAVRWTNEAARAASEHFSCKTCASPLIRQADAANERQAEITTICVACGDQSTMPAAMVQAVVHQYYRDLYEAHTQGGELAVVVCPECEQNAVVVDLGECAACGYELGPETEWCETCRNPLHRDYERALSHGCLAHD
jgi:hypothetical protein